MLLCKRTLPLIMPQPKLFRSICETAAQTVVLDDRRENTEPCPIPDGRELLCRYVTTGQYVTTRHIQPDMQKWESKNEFHGPILGPSIRGSSVTYDRQPFRGGYKRLYAYGTYDTVPAEHTHSFLRGISNHKWNPMIARHVFTRFILYRFTLDLEAFTMLVNFYCQEFKHQHIINAVFVEMKALGVKPDDVFFKSLMDGMCNYMGPNLSYQLLKKLRRNQFQIPLSCYNVVVTEFCKRKMIEDAEIVFNDMKQHGVLPDEYIYSCLLKEYSQDFGGEGLLKAASLRKQMSEQGIELNCDMVSILINGFCRFGLRKAALDLFNGYREMGFKFDKNALCHVMDCYSKIGYLDEVIKMVKEMKGHTMNLDFVDLVVLIESYYYLGRIDYMRRRIGAEMFKNGFIL